MSVRLDTYRDLVRLIRAEAKARHQRAAEHVRICAARGGLDDARNGAGREYRRVEAAEFLTWLERAIKREVGE